MVLLSIVVKVTKTNIFVQGIVSVNTTLEILENLDLNSANSVMIA